MAKVRTTLCIERFDVAVNLAESFVCGGVNGEFEVTIFLTTRGLTAEGYVAEVRSLMDAVKNAYAPGRGMLKASCEELAGGVVHVIHKALPKRVISIEAHVKNLTGHVLVEWEKGNEVPEFPRTATRAEREASTKPSQRKPAC